MDLSNIPIIYVDFEGAMLPHPSVPRLMMEFSTMALNRKLPSVQILERLHRRGAKFIFNARTSDPVPQMTGRLHRLDGRPLPDPSKEYLQMINRVRFNPEMLLENVPLVIHHSKVPKGVSMAAISRKYGFSLENTAAIDNTLDEMEGYPLDRVVLTNPFIGINQQTYEAVALKLDHLLLPVKRDPAEIPPRTPPQP